MTERKRTKYVDALLSEEAPFRYKESYNQFRTNLRFIMAEKKYKTILITSAIAGEGKTTIAINAAQVLAEAGAKVVLVDCDMRNPSVLQRLKIQTKERNGLADVLSGQCGFESALFRMEQLGVDIIAGGTIPANPSELISTKRMEIILNALAKYYDYVICDAPPVGIVTDATVLSKYCDGVILVVRQGVSSRGQVRMAKKSLTQVKCDILGAVFNGANVTKMGYEYNNYYGYGR